MRWEDERYVKLYTRDTPEWLCVPTLSRCFFYELLRKVDGAGILPLGKRGAESLAGMYQLPLATVMELLTPLLEDGCVVVEGNSLVIPNHIEAQDTRASEAAKKRSQRERARAIARNRLESVEPKSQPVPTCPAVSPDVPECPQPAQHSTAQLSPAKQAMPADSVQELVRRWNDAERPGSMPPPLAAADPDDPAAVPRVREKLAQEIARLGPDRALQVCRETTEKYRKKHGGRVPSAFGYFVGPLRDTDRPDSRAASPPQQGKNDYDRMLEEAEFLRKSEAASAERN